MIEHWQPGISVACEPPYTSKPIHWETGSVLVTEWEAEVSATVSSSTCLATF